MAKKLGLIRDSQLFLFLLYTNTSKAYDDANKDAMYQTRSSEKRPGPSAPKERHTVVQARSETSPGFAIPPKKNPSGVAQVAIVPLSDVARQAGRHDAVDAAHGFSLYQLIGVSRVIP